MPSGDSEGLRDGDTSGPERQDGVEALARYTASSHTVALGLPPRANLTRQLNDCRRVLERAHASLAGVFEHDALKAYVSEWLLDNYYIVQRVIRDTPDDIPSGFYRKLPALAEGSFEGCARIYATAHTLLTTNQCQLTSELMEQFLEAYQEDTPLTTGELWAFAPLMRVAVIQILAASVDSVLNQGPEFERMLPDVPLDLAVGNCIQSLRLLDALDWEAFHDRISLVERGLRADPSGAYPRMDFESRDRYRAAVEALSESSSASETQIVQITNDLASDAQGRGSAREAHVGYYLVDDGRDILREKISYRSPFRGRISTAIMGYPAVSFFGSLALVTASIEAVALTYAVTFGATPVVLAAIAILVLVPAMTVAVSVVNVIVTRVLPPRVLYKMDFRRGLPTSARTLLVVPALMTKMGDADGLVRELELHYLRNPIDNLWFALLTDYSDAASQHMPNDEDLVESVSAGIRDLNARYGTGERQPFLLLHRERRWNGAERIWMGWERKRGKLEELNRLILARGETSYVTRVGDIAALSGIKYVITLDADTVLPQDGAARLVGALAHPLNAAEFDEGTQKVAAGYTVLQPRPEIRPTSANRSLFARIFAWDAGLDLYTHAASDVYQDLFGEGIYVGKGVYDVSAFHRCTGGRVPENALLSHDLFEGVQGRAGLVTDIVVFEDFPVNYFVSMKRLHRWIRGDWQLFPWLFPWVPHPEKGRTKNDFNTLARWKIADNLRRSLLEISLLALLITSWFWLPGHPLVWTLSAICVPAVPLLTGTFTTIARARSDELDPDLHALRRDVTHWAFAIAFMPYEALIKTHAIGITLYRVFVSHRNMLQWTTAAETEKRYGSTTSPTAGWRQFSLVWAGSAGILTYAIAAQSGGLPIAIPFLVAWVLSPLLAHWLGNSPRGKIPQIDEAAQARLRNLARKTWYFFEQFVGPRDHWLPPDHFQEHPNQTVARRTSPTNIGLYCLSALSAYELGYIDMPALFARLQNTLDTMGRMAKHHGHLLNWYETHSLAPLSPRYVSTVDSGNLAACLIAVRQGIARSTDDPVPRQQRWEGLRDTLRITMESVSRVADEEVAEAARLLKDLQEFEQTICAVTENPSEWGTLLNRSTNEILPRLQDDVVTLLRTHSTALDLKSVHQLNTWFKRMQAHLQNMRREADVLVPWVQALCDAPALPASADAESDIGRNWKKLVDHCPGQARLCDIETICAEILNNLERVSDWIASDTTNATGQQDALTWCGNFEKSLLKASAQASELINAASEICDDATDHLDAMSFGFLYDRHRNVFRIGYNVDSEALDANCYDLLASEARITSLVAIAKGDVPVNHWLHLGRPLTRVGAGHVLMSWNGSMFEYLMPNLLVRSYAHTLLDVSTEGAVQRQIEYAHEHGVPWGFSESGYFHFDANMNYQYRGFGVPKMGFKRGLSEDLVVTPYACMLALAYRPKDVVQNLVRLEALGLLGDYGLYEAIDFTPSRQSLGRAHSLVQSFMAHHQGMILVSLTNYLKNDVMSGHFHEDLLIQSVDLLLQEQIPKGAPLEKVDTDEPAKPTVREDHFVASSWRVPNETPLPYVHFLSNGRLGAMITNRGSGYSVWDERDVTRWSSDALLDDAGLWIYLQDCDTGDLWAIGECPLGDQTFHHETQFQPHGAIFQSSAHGISARMELVIAPDDDVEIRRLKLVNNSTQIRSIRITYSAEIVLASRSEYTRHSTFSKLFVESRFDSETNILEFSRRVRDRSVRPMHAAFGMTVKKTGDTSFDFETDRYEFLGRGRGPANPSGLFDSDHRLSSTAGRVRDPIAVLQKTLVLNPYETSEIAFLMALAESPSKAAASAAGLRDWTRIQHTFDQARVQTEIEMRELEMESSEIARVQRLLGPLLYPCKALRSESSVLAQNIRGQTALWGFDISGDYPILLLKVRGDRDTRLLVEILRAHMYWRNRLIKIDLVILDYNDGGYEQEDQGKLKRLIRRMKSEAWLGRRGGIFLLRQDVLDHPTSILLSTVASVVLEGSGGSLHEQLRSLVMRDAALPILEPAREIGWDPAPTPPLQRPVGLLFDNGIGGFDPDGREYVMYITRDCPTPAPWINVIANPHFGTQVSESGAGFTWSVNSGENRLTPWMNDPVSDPAGEALYLRDEETAKIWSPTPAPAGDNQPYLVRHGHGYTTFEHHSEGLEQHVEVFVAHDAPIKVIKLRVKNVWPRVRRLTATYFAEWVLGSRRDNVSSYIVPTYDHATRALLACNTYNELFTGRTAFLASSRALHGLTTDRGEFLGSPGNRSCPAALRRVGLSGLVECGVDPCAALQVHLDLQPNEVKELYFLLGEESDRESALRIIGRFQNPQEVDRASRDARAYWNALLGRIEVDTPEPSMNVLLNGWLVYQNLVCRIWGRSAVYQSSGAFGFRDQLQDVLALLFQSPEIARAHILRAARHQFEEGDVLHWWHPPTARGVRTRISDDLLWLPYVTARYVTATGDKDILNERVPFLHGEPLGIGEHERYGVYNAADTSFTLYEHCIRALEKGSTRGARGLPLMGTGDWNDGMDRVGEQGQGESIWLGWFLFSTCMEFSPLCEDLGEYDQASRLREQADSLRAALEEHAWDGAWYRRAYYDDGHPLGSSESHECRIDAVAQSWAVLSGAAQPERARQAMESVYETLVRNEDQLVLLFAPPFESTEREPGYIKGYPPGVRENGGQYTHAAIWTAWAFAELGDGDRAEELFRYLNPIEHARTADQIEQYRVEPYVIAADVYSGDGYRGRGGWTWYTGSSAWMYRLGIEAILGLELRAGRLRINPTIPKSWPGFSLAYRHGSSTLKIRVDNAQSVSSGVTAIYVDGEEMPTEDIPLVDDGKSHDVLVCMGRPGDDPVYVEPDSSLSPDDSNRG